MNPITEAVAYAVAIGTPFGGIRLFGPFFTHEEALAWAEEVRSESWQIVPIEEAV